MDYLINESTIRNYLGGASFVSGLICFTHGSTYDRLFGKLGFGGLIVYIGISLSILYLIWGFKRIRVPEIFLVGVETILFVVIVGLDKLVPGKSDALSIISYGLFALMSVSTSRKSEFGFETGFFSFFLSLFLKELYETNLKLFPFAVIFCFFIFVLRHRSLSASPNGDHPQEVAINNGDEESQYSPEQSLLPTSNQENNESYEDVHHPPSNNGGVSEESILEVIWDNQQNNDQEEASSSFPATHLYSPSHYGQVSEESISGGGNEQTNEQEEDNTSSLAAEFSYSSEQDHVSPANYRNGYAHSSPPQLLRRRRRMTRAIQHISSSLGDKLRRWPPPHLFSFFLSSFFFFKMK